MTTDQNEDQKLTETETPPNPYFGRKSFRTGN